MIFPYQIGTLSFSLLVTDWGVFLRRLNGVWATYFFGSMKVWLDGMKIVA